MSKGYWMSHWPLQVSFFSPKKVAVMLSAFINELLNDGAEMSE